MPRFLCARLLRDLTAMSLLLLTASPALAIWTFEDVDAPRARTRNPISEHQIAHRPAIGMHVTGGQESGDSGSPLHRPTTCPAHP
jgi:hypothetical protein